MTNQQSDKSPCEIAADAGMGEKLAELLQPQSTQHWGVDYEFTPALLGKVYGDGKGILQLFPINERPRYWLVRVDSQCASDDALCEILDDIYDQIDEQFGTPSEEDGVGDERPYFPKYDGQGTSWRFHSNHVANHPTDAQRRAQKTD